MFGKKLVAVKKPAAAPRQFTTKVGAPRLGSRPLWCACCVQRLRLCPLGCRSSPHGLAWFKRDRWYSMHRERDGETEGWDGGREGGRDGGRDGGWDGGRDGGRAPQAPGRLPAGHTATWFPVLTQPVRAHSQLEGFSIGEEDCGMMGGNCGQRLFSTRPNRVSLTRAPAARMPLAPPGQRVRGTPLASRAGDVLGSPQCVPPACPLRAWSLSAPACVSSCTRCAPVLPVFIERSAEGTRWAASKVCARTVGAARRAVRCGNLHTPNAVKGRCCQSALVLASAERVLLAVLKRGGWFRPRCVQVLLAVLKRGGWFLPRCVQVHRRVTVCADEE